MKPRFIYWTVSLIAVLVVSACAPTVPSAPAEPTAVSPQEAVQATAAPVDPAAPAEVPIQAVATSRGPNLEATDPASVSLASGQLQLIEFFRFT